MIKCSKCGFENKLGHLYCVQCRKKLDYNQVPEKDLVDVRPASGRAMKIVVLLFLAMVVLTIGLALWPERAQVQMGTKDDFNQARRKIALIERGVSSAPQVFTEKEINVCLAFILQGVKKSEGSLWIPQVQSVAATVRPNAVIIAVNGSWGPVALGSVNLGPLPMSYQVSGMPGKDAGVFSFMIQSGKFGHLPLPGPAGRLLVAPLLSVFQGLYKEQAFLNKLNGFELDKGQITVSVNKTDGK